jgi:hypothetical protein
MADQLSFQSQVIAALQDKIPSPRCPLCGHSDWEVPPGAFTFHYQMRSLYGSTMHANAHPCAAMICKTCGDTQFVSLAVLSPSLAKEYL